MTKSKKLTGVIFTNEEFEKLNECLQCGKLSSIKKNSVCEVCIKEDLKKCEVCEILLRNREMDLYTYDTQEHHRDNLKFKPKRDVIREFIYKSDIVESEGNLCSKCVGWKFRIRQNCWLCKFDFHNSEENYKLNGNMCRYCAGLFLTKYKRN